MKLIEKLWKKHFVDSAGSYHGSMALTFQKILGDPLCDGLTAQLINNAVHLHCRIERTAEYKNGHLRQWFCEVFGTDEEKRGR